MHDSRFSQLTDSQRKAVFHLEGPLLVLAGPGSGKTRVITYRIAALINSGVNPRNICAVTFTNKAAEEMRQRAVSLGATSGTHISTFHSLCVRILRRYADTFGIQPNFSIYNESEQSSCIKQAIKDCELDKSNFTPARMLEAVSALKNRLIDVESFTAHADDFFSKSLARIYSRYQQTLKENNALDFDDLLMATAFSLDIHKDICAKLNERFKFLLIDEYQDTNHAQYKIAKALVTSHNNICVTGDPDQSIYRWRGADIGNILAFEKDWPDATVVKLEENFRSTPNILQVADNLISANRNRKSKILIPTRAAGQDVSVTAFEDEQQEALGISERIEQLKKKGSSLRDIALFYRINAMSRVLEEVFIRQKIPYQIVRGVEFYNRKEIRDVLAYLKVIANPDDEIALLRIINTPARGIGKTTIDRVKGYAASRKLIFYEALKKAKEMKTISDATKAKIAVFVNMIEGFKKDSQDSIAEFVERVFSESGLERSLIDDKNAMENVKELINSAALYDSNADEPFLLDYLQQIALFTDADSYDPEKDRVALMTLHTAKGLEFENVFIIGLEDGLLPHEKSSEDEDELEEERRLFFVGITRAKENLHISYSKYRTFRGQLCRTIPSQFLFELKIPFTETDRSFDLDESHTEQYTVSGPCEDDDAFVQFRPGQLVRHKAFGLGRVKEFISMGENSIVVVRFNSGKTKSLMLKYADLSES